MNESTHPRRRWPAVALTVVIGAAAFALSFAALRDLAGGHGVPGPLAALWPLAVDGAIILATALVLTVPSSRYGWAMLAGAVSTSIAGNAVHAVTWGPIGVAVAAVPPVALVACTHALVVLGRPTPGAVRTGSREKGIAEPVPPVRSEPATVSAERTPSSVNTPAPAELPAVTVKRPTRAEYTRRARRALSAAHRRGEHPAPTVSWVMNTAGCSRGTAAKIAAELRRPALAEAVDQ